MEIIHGGESESTWTDQSNPFHLQPLVLFFVAKVASFRHCPPKESFLAPLLSLPRHANLGRHISTMVSSFTLISTQLLSMVLQHVLSAPSAEIPYFFQESNRNLSLKFPIMELTTTPFHTQKRKQNKQILKDFV